MCKCAPSLVALRSEINKRWPARDKASDGCCGDQAHAARRSDHNADSSGYAHALDIDEDITQGGSRPLWDTLLPVLLRDFRTRYVIYEGRIMYPDGRNNAYTGPNAHLHHLHLSIKTTATFDTRRWLTQDTPAASPVLPEPAVTDYPEDSVKRIDVQIDTDANGRGYRDITASPREVISVISNTANPPDQGYKPIPDVARLDVGGRTRIVVEEAVPNGRIDVAVWVA